MGDEQKKTDPWQKYFRQSGNFTRLPENQFSHAWSLISSKGRTITRETEHNELRDPNAFLGFVDNDNMIRFYQNDAMFLENLFAIGKRSPQIFEVFDVLFNAWIFELRLTANKQGIERRLQHSFPESSQFGEGFGKSWQKEEKRRRKEQEQGGVKGEMYE